MDSSAPSHAHLDTIQRDLDDGTSFQAVRRALGATAFAINAFGGARPGDEIIEPHDETSPSAGGHEELYFVHRGAARFVVGDSEIVVTTGGLLLIPVGIHRSAAAVEDDTVVLVIGGKPGAALPVSPFEHWYVAEGVADAGDLGAAADIVAAGLVDWPNHPRLHYEVARSMTRAGRNDEALHHLAEAFANDPNLRFRAASDDDFATILADPHFHSGS